MRIRASRNGKQSMNDATFADCSGMWSATFLPTSYCQLNITYRCREISIDAVINAVVEGVTIVGREKKFHRLVWDRLREREREKKNTTEIFTIRRGSTSSPRSCDVSSVHFSSLPCPHFESISSAPACLPALTVLSRINFIIRDGTNPLWFNNRYDYLTEAKARRYYTYCNERTKERAFKSCRLLFMRPSAWFTTGCIFYA